MKGLGKSEARLLAGTFKDRDPDSPIDDTERLFLLANNKLVTDRAIWDRIKWLTGQVLVLVGIEKKGGWEKLYRDPNDGRYWLLTYPFGELQGGGPPELIHRQLSESDIKSSFVTPAEWDSHMEKYMRDNNIRIIAPDDKAKKA